MSLRVCVCVFVFNFSSFLIKKQRFSDDARNVNGKRHQNVSDLFAEKSEIDEICCKIVVHLVTSLPGWHVDECLKKAAGGILSIVFTVV